MSNSSYYSAAPEIPSHCRCGFPVGEKQAWACRNPGRKFVGCKFYNPAGGMRGCDTFMWVDRHQEEWQRVVINQLLLEKNLLHTQLYHLKAKVCGLEDDNSKLLKENEKLKMKNKKKPKSKLTNKGQVNYLLFIVVGVLVAIHFMIYVA